MHSLEGDLESGIIDFSESIALNPDDSQVFFNRGTNFLSLGRLTDSKKDFDSALEINCHYPDAHNSRGVYYSLIDEHSDAVKDFVSAIEEWGEDLQIAIAHRNHALSQIVLGDLKSADESINIANKISPNDKFTISARAHLEYATGNFQRSLELFELAQKASSVPDEFRVFTTLPLFRLDRPEDAVETIRRFLSSNPKAIVLTRIRSQILNLHKSHPDISRVDEILELIGEFISAGQSQSF